MVAELVEPLRAAHPGLVVKHKTVMTTGDLDRKSSLSSLGAETAGAFATQLEAALLAGEIDLAVHSLKDLATAMPDGLALSAVPVFTGTVATSAETWTFRDTSTRITTGNPAHLATTKYLRPAPAPSDYLATVTEPAPWSTRDAAPAHSGRPMLGHERRLAGSGSTAPRNQEYAK